MSGAFEVRRLGPEAYAVFRNGRQVSGPSTNLLMAEEKMTAMERRARCRVRPCLSCGGDFESEGAHNRMCTRCRSRACDMFGGVV